jgi:hypothetical protein
MITGASFSSASVPISYNITYTAQLSATSSAGVGIVGYDTLQTNDFSINASISGFTTTYIHLTARALDTTIITYLSINFIAVGAQTYFM